MSLPHDRDPRLVEDDNVFLSGRTFHATGGAGAPMNSTRVPAVSSSTPARRRMPPASAARSKPRPGSAEPGMDAGRAIMLYNAADLTLAKDARCQTAKAADISPPRPARR